MMMATQSLPLEFLKLLAHDVRWQLLQALAESDRRVQELREILQKPQNLVSYHLRLLRDGNVVHERRSSADGRDVYYSLDLNAIRSLYQLSGQALHPALGRDATPALAPSTTPTDPVRVLFLCTHNSARSQLAEAILRAEGGDRVQVFSAGSEPGQVHPMAQRVSAEMGLDVSQQRSKHMDEFAGETFDIVITVCDKVREICPVFPDEQRIIHWSFADPAEVRGEAAQHAAFVQTAKDLATRVRFFLLTMNHSD